MLCSGSKYREQRATETWSFLSRKLIEFDILLFCGKTHGSILLRYYIIVVKYTLLPMPLDLTPTEAVHDSRWLAAQYFVKLLQFIS